MSAVVVSDRTGRQVSFDAAPGERILHAGLLAGAGLPFECASGTCGACKARRVAGEVIDLWPEAPGRKVLRAADEILMCQSTCVGGVALALRGTLAAAPDPTVRRFTGEMSRTALLTPDVALFEVELDEPVDYLPGQFALLGLEGVPGLRAYSMTRHESDASRLHFLVRRFPDGGFSSTLFAPTFAPRAVDITGPLGKAVFRPSEARSFLAIAGGSGIAGMLSILDCARRAGHCASHPSELVFGVRDPASAYLLDVLDQAAQPGDGGLTITVAFSHAEADQDLARRHSALTFTTGFVHDVALARADAMRDLRPIHFVAGPPPMVDATMRGLIIDRRISPAEIRYDRFG
jgi:toluene monooxygenase electron transfer component